MKKTAVNVKLQDVFIPLRKGIKFKYKFKALGFIDRSESSNFCRKYFLCKTRRFSKQTP
jgi:hypothetical protein